MLVSWPWLSIYRYMRIPWLAGVVPLVLIVAACRTAPARPFTYVAIGASDTVGVGARDPDTEGWVPRLAGRMGRDIRLVNLGVSGSTLAQALDEQLAAAVDAKPDVVTVWLAVNDFNARVPLDRYAQDLNQMLQTLHITHARVLVANVPDLAQMAPFARRDQVRQEVQAWNEVIAAATARHGARLVDLHAHWQEAAEHPEYLSADGFHPSSEGYARLADLFAEALDGSR
jgi:acyl-CoA thioesterase I